MLIFHSLLLMHLKNDGVMLLLLCWSPLAWCILCKFSPNSSNSFFILPIFSRCCLEPFHPNHTWLDAKLEALFLIREMGMATQEDHILNYWQKTCLFLSLVDLSNQSWTFIASFSASQKIPNAPSMERLPVKWLSFAPSLLSASGIWNNASLLLLMNFVSLNPPLLHRSVTSWVSVRASLTDVTDFSTSSTWKFMRRLISCLFYSNLKHYSELLFVKHNYNIQRMISHQTHVYTHFIINIVLQINILPPQVWKEVSFLFRDVYLVKHGFNISHEHHFFSP